MQKQESGSISTFIMGAVVGAGVALLFAPEAGVQIRRLLREYMTCAKGEFDKTIDRSTEMLDRTVEQGQEFIAKGKEALRESGREAKEEVVTASVAKGNGGGRLQQDSSKAA